MTFVLDASVSLSWCFEDEVVEYADAVLDGLASAGAIVPVIWPYEQSTGLLVAERRKRLTFADTAKALSLFGDLSITVDASPPTQVLDELLPLARAQDLSAYDATYLELALRTGCPMATLDKCLRRACERTGIAIWNA